MLWLIIFVLFIEKVSLITNNVERIIGTHDKANIKPLAKQEVSYYYIIVLDCYIIDRYQVQSLCLLHIPYLYLCVRLCVYVYICVYIRDEFIFWSLFVVIVLLSFNSDRYIWDNFRISQWICSYIYNTILLNSRWILPTKTEEFGLSIANNHQMQIRIEMPLSRPLLLYLRYLRRHWMETYKLSRCE